MPPFSGSFSVSIHTKIHHACCTGRDLKKAGLADRHPDPRTTPPRHSHGKSSCPLFVLLSRQAQFSASSSRCSPCVLVSSRNARTRAPCDREVQSYRSHEHLRARRWARSPHGRRKVLTEQLTKHAVTRTSCLESLKFVMFSETLLINLATLWHRVASCAPLRRSCRARPCSQGAQRQVRPRLPVASAPAVGGAPRARQAPAKVATVQYISSIDFAGLLGAPAVQRAWSGCVAAAEHVPHPPGHAGPRNQRRRCSAYCFLI